MREPDSKKGDSGRVLVVGGSDDYPGAVVFTSLAALRMGADIVKAACPEKVAWAMNCYSPDPMTIKLPGRYLAIRHYKRIIKEAENADVLVLGNGAGTRKETKELFRKLICLDVKKVIDADGIKVVRVQDARNAVFTPHAREFEILLKNSGLTSFKEKLGENIILLKGNPDRIISKDRELVNRTGNPGMTVGGTGDILAGICAGYLCQGESLFDSALKGAKLAGDIGDQLKKKYGYGFISSDFIELIGKRKLYI